MIESPLKPCPFCGGRYMAAHVIKEDSTRCSAYIKCGMCGAQSGQEFSYDGEKTTALNAAAKLWNNRPYEEET